MTPARNLCRWLCAGLLCTSLATIGRAEAPRDNVLIYGPVETVNWSALQIMISGQYYQLSGSTLTQWQGGARTDLQSLQPGLRVQMLIEPPYDSEAMPRVRSLILQAD